MFTPGVGGECVLSFSHKDKMIEGTGYELSFFYIWMKQTHLWDKEYTWKEVGNKFKNWMSGETLSVVYTTKRVMGDDDAHLYHFNLSDCIFCVCVFFCFCFVLKHTYVLIQNSFFTAVLRTTSAVLLLGNMQFRQERNSDQAVLPDDTG